MLYILSNVEKKTVLNLGNHKPTFQDRALFFSSVEDSHKPFFICNSKAVLLARGLKIKHCKV